MNMTIPIILVTMFLLAIIYQKITTDPVPNDITDKDIQNLIDQGKKIQAMKSYRVLHNVGLKDAKEAIEDIIENQKHI